MHVIVAVLRCLCIISISSCSNDPAHPNYTNTVDTYVISFSGDRDVFKGELSISTISEGCTLKSDSFEEQSKSYCSDRNFREYYDIELLSLIHISEPTRH